LLNVLHGEHTLTY